MEQYPLNYDINEFSEREKKPMSRRSWLLLIGVIVLIGFFTWNTHRMEEIRRDEAAANGTLIYYMPELALHSFDDTKKHYLDEYFGDGIPVVVSLWSSQCDPCVQELAAFEEVRNEYGENVRFVLISMVDGTDETVESAKTFIDGSDYDAFYYYYDDSGKVADALGAKKIPLTFFVYDAAGYIATVAEGRMEAKDIREAIELCYDKIYERENNTTVNEEK